MKCTLFINYYLDKSEERQAELDFCLLENLSNELIDRVVCVVAPDEIAEFKEIVNVKEFIKTDKLLTEIKYLEHHNFMLIKKR
jgi:hypothetical protein